MIYIFVESDNIYRVSVSVCVWLSLSLRGCYNGSGDISQTELGKALSLRLEFWLVNTISSIIFRKKIKT